MRAPSWIAGSLLSLALCAAPASGDELVLNDHHMIEGEVVSITYDTIEIKVAGSSSETALSVDVSTVEPYSLYTLMKPRITDAKGHVALAEYCLANELYNRARSQLKLAVKADPSMMDALKGDLAKANAGSATVLVEQAKAEMAKGDTAQANADLLGVLRHFADTPAAKEAGEIYGQNRQQVAGKRAAKRASQVEHDVDQHLAKITRLVDRGSAYDTAGLKGNNQSQSLQGFGKAETEYRRALNELNALAKKYQNDGEAMKRIGDEQGIVQGDLINTLINEGSVYVTRTSYEQALTAANNALAIDPKSAQAKAFRVRVESLSSSSGW